MRKLKGSTVLRRRKALIAAQRKANAEHREKIAELVSRCSHDRAYTYSGTEYSDSGWECPDCGLEQYRAPEGWVAKEAHNANR